MSETPRTFWKLVELALGPYDATIAVKELIALAKELETENVALLDRADRAEGDRALLRDELALTRHERDRALVAIDAAHAAAEEIASNLRALGATFQPASKWDRPNGEDHARGSNPPPSA